MEMLLFACERVKQVYNASFRFTDTASCFCKYFEPCFRMFQNDLTIKGPQASLLFQSTFQEIVQTG